MQRGDAIRVVDALIAAKPERISIGGGEPLLVPWYLEAVERFTQAGIRVSLFTSGWLLSEKNVGPLARRLAVLAVSIDGFDEGMHDMIRGRKDAFQKGRQALKLAVNEKRALRLIDASVPLEVGVDFTVTQASADISALGDFVEELTTEFVGLDFVRFGAVIPGGLASTEGFQKNMLLSLHQSDELVRSEALLRERARSGTAVVITDVRAFLPPHVVDVDVAQIEPDGQMRAFPTFEAKVGSVLDVPVEELWQRASVWRRDPTVTKILGGIASSDDWADATRQLDCMYGSDEDKIRIANRPDFKILAGGN